MRHSETTHASDAHIEPATLSRMSDDECLDLLAQEVQAHDSGHLDDVAMLIGRLAVPIEI